MNKIIRSICHFSENPGTVEISKLDNLEKKFIELGFQVQTKRLCTKSQDILSLEKEFDPEKLYLSIGTLTLEKANKNLPDFFTSKNTAFNIDLTNEEISMSHVDFLFNLVNKKPEKTFLFTFVFQNSPSSPYLPAANFQKQGFSIGLQPPDLSSECKSLNEWFENMKKAWDEIMKVCGNDPEFLGIDSSTAPLLGDSGSLIGMMNRFGYNFSDSVTTDVYLKITEYIKKENPKPIGLCGLMIPCLEDTYLAKEYEKGYFSIERNLFLSLHCGLGIDVYPIGVDEKKEKVLNVLKLIKGLAIKYNKPLSARFVSDGVAKVGERTQFKNEFLEDVIVRPL